MTDHRFNLALLIGLIGVLVWSGIGPHDRLTWALEVAPVVIAIALLLATYRRYRLTRLAYVAIFLHGIILCIGAHWTYARVPLGEWVKAWLEIERNHYDRLGHFVQGFFPAILAREVFLRSAPVPHGRWLRFFVTASCLAISATFELFEWLVATISGDDAVAYLATQGDQWDTQWDMFLALCGAILAQLTLHRLHDHQLRERGLLKPDGALR